MTRPHAESHRRIKLIGAELDRLITRLRSLGEAERVKVSQELTQTVQAASRQPELSDWASFLDTHQHLILRGGALALLQASVGLASASLVTLAAEDWALGRSWKVPWFRRTQRPREHRAGSLLRTIEANARRPFAIGIFAESARVLLPSACRRTPGLLELWSLESGQLLAQAAREGLVESLCVLPDGSGALIGGDDGAVERWTLEPLARVSKLSAHQGSVGRLAISADGRVAVSHGLDAILVHELETGRLLGRIKAPEGAPHLIAVSPDGALVLLASRRGTLSLFGRDGHELAPEVVAHSGPIEALLTHPSGAFITAGQDGQVKAWSGATLEALGTLATQKAPVRVLAIDDAGGVMVGDDGGELHLLAAPLEAATASHDAAALSTDEPTSALSSLKGGEIAAGGADGGVRLLDRAAVVLGQAPPADGRIISLTSLDASGRVAAVSDDGAVRVLELRTASSQPSLMTRSIQAIDTEGQRTLCLSPSNELELWDMTEGRKIRRVMALGERMRFVGAHVDANLALIESFQDKLSLLESAYPLPYQRALSLIDIDKGEVLRSFTPHKRSTRAAAFHPDGARLVCAGGDRRVRVLDLRDGATRFSLEGHEATVTALALHPDGKRATSIDALGRLCVWNIDRGKRLACHELNIDGLVWSLVLSAESDTVTAGTDAGVIATFDLESGRRLRSNADHGAEIGALALSDDGAYLVSAGGDRTLRLFAARSLKPLCRWESPSPVVGCAFLPDGRVLLWHPKGEAYYLKFNDWGLGDDL